MKKIIAAAAGLMLVGTMGVTVNASETTPVVSISGDARVRMIMKRDFWEDAEEADYINSRIRVTTKYQAKGGAYAIFRMRIADTTLSAWDGTNNSTSPNQPGEDRGWEQTGSGANNNFWIDRGYIGIPVGPVTIEGGAMHTYLTKFTDFDSRTTRLQAIYKNGDTDLRVYYQKMDEGDINLDISVDEDEDVNRYGVELRQKVGKDWKVVAHLGYEDDEADSADSGFLGSVSAFGKVAGLGIEAEIKFEEEGGVTMNAGGPGSQADDDALAGQVSVSGKAGDLSLKGTAAFFQNGAHADQDWGYQMLGSSSPITLTYSGLNSSAPGWAGGSGVGGNEDSWLLGLTAGMKISDKTTLTGYLAYLDLDEDVDGAESALEISAKISYAVSQGATLSAGAGMVSIDTDDPDVEDAIGAFGEMSIKF